MVGRQRKGDTEQDRMLLDLEQHGGGDTEEMPTMCCHYRRGKRGMLAAQVQVPKKMLRIWCDFAASIVIILELLVVPDTLLACVSSFASVYLWDLYAPDFTMNLTWTAVSLMLAFPLQNAIREAYKRREAALQALMDVRAVLLNIYLAHAVWNWPGTSGFEGREEDGRPKEEGGAGTKKGACNVPLAVSHSDSVKDLMFRILEALQEFLMVPRSGHARNELVCGRTEVREVDSALDQGRDTIMLLLGRLHHACEDLKAAGMPANEASRINQYNLMVFKDFEKLWAFKTYYTPIALRALLRVFIQIVPFVYGPYWLHIAKGDSGKERSLVFAISFSIMLTCLLIAMNNLQDKVENPFRAGDRDTIRVVEEVNLTKRALTAYADDMSSRWQVRSPFPWEHGCQEDSEASSVA